MNCVHLALRSKGKDEERNGDKKSGDKLCEITLSDILSRFQHENLK